jgi:hypothetical protein
MKLRAQVPGRSSSSLSKLLVNSVREKILFDPCVSGENPERGEASASAILPESASQSSPCTLLLGKEQRTAGSIFLACLPAFCAEAHLAFYVRRIRD